MARITEVARIDGKAYGVSFVVCNNGEVARLALNLEHESDAITAMHAEARKLAEAGFDYVYESSFQAYNGGPRVNLVDAVYYVADIFEDDELDEWRKTWQRGAGATQIPAEVTAKVEAIVG